jgi:transposase
MRQIAREVRQIIIYQTEKLGWNTPQVAKSLNLSTRTVQRVKKLHHELGVIIDEHTGPPGRPKLMSEDDINVFHCIFHP